MAPCPLRAPMITSYDVVQAHRQTMLSIKSGGIGLYLNIGLKYQKDSVNSIID